MSVPRYACSAALTPVQMHLGYHELRKMLEEFGKRKAAVSGTRPTASMPPPDAPVAPRPPERDYRSRADDGYKDRDRDRDYARSSAYERSHSSRLEYVQVSSAFLLCV